jgi:hypothetical protein
MTLAPTMSRASLALPTTSQIYMGILTVAISRNGNYRLTFRLDLSAMVRNGLYLPQAATLLRANSG